MKTNPWIPTIELRLLCRVREKGKERKKDIQREPEIKRLWSFGSDGSAVNLFSKSTIISTNSKPC